MGIPSYYKNLIQDYPHIILPQNELKSTINNLFLDLNCAIHPCCAKKTDENEMYEAIFEKIKECIDITKVNNLVYIAIDGPAPRTKMEQQRQRRLKSINEKKIWDTNQITPGTDFMDQLSIFLNEKCQSLPIKWIISDSNEPGEGEHKIMKYIDSLPKNDINVVYGLDADLIMLSMIRKHKVFLLRERTEFNIEKLDCEYIYCDISLLKKYLIESIKKSYFQISNECILNDYLFLCFLIGNDFIINTPCINIRYNGLNYLIDIYIQLQKEYNGGFFLINEKKQIHIEYFKLYIKRLSSKEDDLIHKTLIVREKQSNFFRRKYNELYQKAGDISVTDIQEMNHEKLNTTKEIFDEFKNHSPIIFKSNEKKVFENPKLYYLNNFYNINNYDPSYNEMLHNDIHKLCHEYIKSIEWTFQYYFHECIHWKWYYQYHFAPLLKDLYEHIKDYESLDCFEEKDLEPHTPQEQLKIVLPNMDNTYYYPSRTPLYSFFKRYLWECHPIMPH